MRNPLVRVNQAIKNGKTYRLLAERMAHM